MKNIIKTAPLAFIVLSIAACSHKKTNNGPDSTSTKVIIDSTVKSSTVIDSTQKLDSLKKINAVMKADSIKNSANFRKMRKHKKGDGADTSMKAIIKEYKKDSVTLHR